MSDLITFKSFQILLYPILILSFSTLYAETDEINKLALKGLEQCYHFRWSEGEKTFDRIITKYINDPRGYHFKSTIYLWYYLSTNDPADYENFIKYSTLVIDKSDEILKSDPSNKDILYILGTNYSCRAMIFTKSGNYLDAIWASKESESILSGIIETDPAYYDAYLGLGLYNFAVDQIPSAFKWALNLAGISGDEKTGLSYIKTTAEKGKLSAVEAQYYLSQILAEVKMDFTSAGSYLKKLSSRYPENLLFNYSTGVLEIKKRNLGQAEKHITKVLNAKDGKFIQLKAFSSFLMGDILFRQNDFSGASVHYRNFLTTAADEAYTGIASYRLGICSEILNDRKGALESFQKSASGNTDLDDDIFAERKGKIYSDRAMTKTEKDLVKYSNLIEAGLYKAAADSLELLLQKKLSEKIEAEIYLYLSEAAFQTGMIEESINYARKSLEFDCAEEKWIHPFACYNAARGYYKLRDTGSMKNFLDKIDDYSDYDYQNKLENMYESLQQD